MNTVPHGCYDGCPCPDARAARRQADEKIFVRKLSKAAFHDIDLALDQAVRMLVSRDEMNAAIHCDAPRSSELTIAVSRARDSLRKSPLIIGRSKK